MHSSENNGTVDVAMRIRRAWSAPAAPLRHIQSRCGVSPRVVVAAGDGAAADAQTLPRAVYHIFPTQTSFSPDDVVLAPEATVADASAPQRASSVVSTTPELDALKAELQAAKHQIALLSAASSQSFGSYAALESENAQLRRRHEELQEENESLKERLAQRDDEIGEQLHLICDLEKRLEEFGPLTLTNKSTWNGRNGE